MTERRPNPPLPAPAWNHRQQFLLYPAMSRIVRAVVVIVSVALGLTLQGAGAAAMAVPPQLASHAMPACRHAGAEVATPLCLGPADGPAAMGASCPQAHCLSPTVLPGPMAADAPYQWARTDFGAGPLGLPVGLAQAPDPFPPRI